MANDKWLVKHYNGREVVHLYGLADASSICGADLAGDPEYGGWHEAVPTSKKINCNDCIQIIRSCKAVKEIDIIK